MGRYQRFSSWLAILFGMIPCQTIIFVEAYTVTTNSGSEPSTGVSRRGWLTSSSWKTAAAATTLATFVVAGPPAPPAHAETKTSRINNPLPELLEAQKTLGTLLDNWKRATVDCTFAEVPRELLEQKNKELLLEKASTFALFDKSVSVETCKTTNRIVRDYLGVTGKGPLVGMDKKLKRGMDFLDDADDLDAYVAGTTTTRTNNDTILALAVQQAQSLHADAVSFRFFSTPTVLIFFGTALENFSQAYSRASSLSYTAGVADFDSVNNFSKEEADSGKAEEANSNLNQAKDAIRQAKMSLDAIVSLLQKGQEEAP